MTVSEILGRKAAIIAATVNPRRAVRDAAASLSLANVAAARVELAAEALHAATRLLYERDARGRFVNQDIGGLIVVPVPWSRGGAPKWGLTRVESDILRRLLAAYEANYRSGKRLLAPPLFVYDADARRWVVNVGDYTDEEAALRWHSLNPITVTAWMDQHRKYKRERRQAAAGSPDATPVAKQVYG